jgi:hypothetical protein
MEVRKSHDQSAVMDNPLLSPVPATHLISGGIHMPLA